MWRAAVRVVAGSGAVACWLAACGVGPVKFGMVPRMAPIGQTRDPDPTRVPFEQGVRPGDIEEATLTAACDPVTLGPVSGGLTVLTLLLHRFTGANRLYGIYGTFDENEMFEKRRKRKPKTKPTSAPAACP